MDIYQQVQQIYYKKIAGVIRNYWVKQGYNGIVVYPEFINGNYEIKSNIGANGFPPRG